MPEWGWILVGFGAFVAVFYVVVFALVGAAFWKGFKNGGW